MMRSPGRAPRIDNCTPSGNNADARSRDEDLVTLAVVDDFGVAGDELDVRFLDRPPHRGDDPPQVVHRQAFFEDEGGREIERDRTADGQIVHGAVHGQPANVPPGKEQGPYDERIGREGQPRASDCAVFAAPVARRTVA